MKKILILTMVMFIANTCLAGDLYKDVPNNASYYNALVKLSEKGIMRGYADGSFHPNYPISRGDYSKVIIKVLKLDNHSVVSGVAFEDIDIKNPYYEAAQIAIYYDLIGVKSSTKHFYPTKPMIRKDAFMLVANHLSDKNITESQAKNTLAKYIDLNSVKKTDLTTLGKADILNLIAVTGKENRIDAEKPLNRADFAVMLVNIMEQKPTVSSKKLEYFAAKKKSFGKVIKTSYVDGDYGIMPVQTVFPVQFLTIADSQKSQVNEIHQAIIPWNLTTRDRYLLIPAGSKLKCKVVEVNKRKFLRKNGNLKIEVVSITTPDKRTANFPAMVINNAQIGLGNKIFKFKRIKTTKSEKTYIKLLENIKIDLTSGLILK